MITRSFKECLEEMREINESQQSTIEYLQEKLRIYDKEKEIAERDEEISRLRNHSICVMSDKEMDADVKFRTKHWKDTGCKNGNHYIYDFKGRLYLEEGNFDKAHKMWDILIKANPNHANIDSDFIKTMKVKLNYSVSDKLHIEEFYLDETDISANLKESMVYDQNGDKCALIKLITPLKGLMFDNGVLGVAKVEQHMNEIWIYIPNGSKKITINHPSHGSIRNYIFPTSIEKARTYIMRVK